MNTRIRRRENGTAVIVVLALLAILLGYVSFNVLTLDRLSREVKFVEKRQIRRLQASVALTNSPSLTNRTVVGLSSPATAVAPPSD